MTDLPRLRPGSSDTGARSRQTAQRQGLVVVLTFVTGSADAMGFLALGGAFSSVMTGNMVLFGLSAGHADAELAQTSGCAIVSFVAGVLLGARTAGTAKEGDPVWPWPVTRALLVEAVVFTGYGIVWELTVGHRSSGWQLVLLMVSAVALGMQSSAVQRFGVSGLSSTYLTGTLTSLIGGVAARAPWSVLRPRVEVLSALMAGAAVSTVLTVHVPRVSPALLLVPLGAVILVSAWMRRRAGMPPRP
jgi:uncharacterized membrane protein YoaK (UPF0700 family)